MPDLLSADEVKAGIGLTGDLNARDLSMLTQIAASVGPVIESIVGPVTPRQETLTVSGGRTAILLPHRPTSIVSVTVNGTAVTDYYADLSAAIVYCGTRTAPRSFPAGEVVIVSEVGMSPIPDHIIFAAMEQCRIWWQQGQQSSHAAYGYDGEVAGSVPMGFAIANRVRELLSPTPALPGFA